MSHIAKDKARLIARVRRLKGQLDAVERALEADAPCGQVLNLVASIRGAAAGLTVEMIEDHIRAHMDGSPAAGTQRDEGAADLIDVIRTYLK